MPITGTNSPIQTSMPASKQKFVHTKKFKYILLTLFIVVCAVLAFYTTFYSPLSPFKQESESELPPINVEEVLDTSTGELKDEFFNKLDELTIDQVLESTKSAELTSEDSESTGITTNLLNSPDLYSTDNEERIYDAVGNEDPENHEVEFTNAGVGTPTIEIKQGDMVTWVNNSNLGMTIKGNNWGNKIERAAGERFSNGFLYLGDYPYKINGEFDGVVRVVR